MKKSSILLFLSLFAILQTITGKDIVINNPVFKVSNTGIRLISKIELTPKETRLYIKTEFIPNWWVKFSKNLYIEDVDSGEKYQSIDIIGGEYDKEIHMPASGDSAFVLIFPPLDKKTKTINYIEPGENSTSTIYEISLDPKAKRIDKNVIPAEVQAWLNKELGKSKKEALTNLDSKDFFADQPVRLIGYIKGYDPRLGFSTGMVYLNNEITREDFPTVIEIHPDGRFEATLAMKYPEISYLSMEKALSNFYLEPGQSLAVILNWDEFLIADRNRNKRHNFTDIQFQGTLAQLNSELLMIERDLPEPPFMKAYSDEAKNIEPLDYIVQQDEFVKPYEEGLNKLIAENKISKRTADLLKMDLAVKKASYLFEYANNYSGYGRDADKTIPLEFYSFLQNIPHDDQKILASGQFSTVINRLEYINHFRPLYSEMRKKNTPPSPEIQFIDYLTDELGLTLDADDQEYADLDRKLFDKDRSITITDENRDEVDHFFELSKTFHEKHNVSHESYKKKYLDPIPQPEPLKLSEETKLMWQMQDSVLFNELNIDKGFLTDIIKSRSMKFNIERTDDKEDAIRLLDNYNQLVSTPFLKSEIQRLFDQKFSESASSGYELPEGKGSDIFRKIIDPFKGKYIIVDFWATSCGPCIGAIKENQAIRKKYADHPLIAFVFVSDEKPSERYNNFVAEQELVNHYNISEDDFKYLRQLFKFNGIPHYVLVDKDGKILNDDFSSYNLEYELGTLLKKEEISEL